MLRTTRISQLKPIPRQIHATSDAPKPLRFKPDVRKAHSCPSCTKAPDAPLRLRNGMYVRACDACNTRYWHRMHQTKETATASVA